MTDDGQSTHTGGTRAASGVSLLAGDVFRPPLSVLVDFQQYTLRLLIKLAELNQHTAEATSGVMHTQGSRDRAEAEPSSASALLLPARDAPVGPHSRHLFPPRPPCPSSSPPPSLQSVLECLLESSLYLFTNQAHTHIRQLKHMHDMYASQHTTHSAHESHGWQPSMGGSALPLTCHQ